MNAGISSHLPISYGTWSLLLNFLLFLIVLACDRSLLGVGTISNMVLCGYSVDFFGWIVDRLIPASFFQPWPVRIGICIPALLLFILAAAVYLSLDVGVAPYDAIPMIIAQRQSRLSFRAVRTLWDLTALAIGVLSGAVFGPVTIIMAFTLGSVIAWVSRKMHRLFTL
ncbi:MAG: YitT family protein [Candidatus Onthomonas sp.]